MTAFADAFLKTDRILVEARLRPVQGERFQPTGFADLGAAEYQLPNGTRMLLVESAQSMANRLERVCIAEDGVSLVDDLKGLPYVRVTLTGAASTVTSSLAEAHRLNSPFILKAGQGAFEKRFAELTQYSEGQAVDWAKVARGVFALDPSSLVHGLFMSNFADGRVRLPRAVTGFIEARNVREVASGGVKNSPIDPAGTLQVEGYDKKVYSNVPYPRTEYVAEEISAFFNIDVALLRGYRLGAAATSLLVGLALWKVRQFLDGAMRLRTACDFRLADGADSIAVKMPAGASLPAGAELLKVVQGAIEVCRKEGLFSDPTVTELTAPTKRKAKDEKGDSDTDDGAPDSER